MKNSLSNNLWHLFPAWIVCVLLPLPFIVFPNLVADGLLQFLCFFLACTGLVAYVFLPNLDFQSLEQPKRIWHLRTMAAGIALLSASIVFSLLRFLISGEHSFLQVFLTVLGVIPPLCITPYLALVTRKLFATTIFTLFLVFCMKLLGCIVVVLVYGWHADQHGYTDMPWTQPNLLVWLFWFNTGVLALVFYILGKRKFTRNATSLTLNFVASKN